MSLDERDYMRRADGSAQPSRSWWQNINPKTVAIALGVLALGFAAVWYLRGSAPPGEGELIVNINTASDQELATLPGIGPALAGLIVAGRPYAAVDELERVRGIGPVLVKKVRPLVTVNGETRKVH